MKIIFVCTGNTCRSPMAESIAKNILKQYSIESRGIFTVDEMPISENAKQVILENGLELPSNSEMFKEKDLEADLILTMTQNHKNELENYYGQSNNVFALSEYIDEELDIEDPIGGTIDDYRDTFNQIKSYIIRLNRKMS